MDDKFICFGSCNPKSSIKDVAKRCLITCPMKNECEFETNFKKIKEEVENEEKKQG